ncbi:MAG: hypothetical protein MJ106_04425 [Lentisphaeria bacterium]|nr:hypothetical protein [Lentisphaeria bacterium]
MKRKELILVVAIALMAGVGSGLFLAKDAVSKKTPSEIKADDGAANVVESATKDGAEVDREVEPARKERRRRRRMEVSSDGTESTESAGEAGGNPMMDFTTDFGGVIRNWLAEESDDVAGKALQNADKDRILEEVYKAVDRFRNGTEKERNDIKAGSAMLQLILSGMTQDIKKNPPEISVSRRQEILENAAAADELFDDLEAEIKDFDDEEKRIFGNTVRVMRGLANALKEAAEK